MSLNAMNRLFWVPMLMALFGSLGLMFWPSVQAADPVGADAKANYQAERQSCLRGESGQDTATCLKEAGAASAEARRGRLDNLENEDAFTRNTVARCDRVAAEDRQACKAMALGGGTRSGSVKGGGVIKEHRELVVPAPAPTESSTLP